MGGLVVKPWAGGLEEWAWVVRALVGRAWEGRTLVGRAWVERAWEGGLGLERAWVGVGRNQEDGLGGEQVSGPEVGRGGGGGGVVLQQGSGGGCGDGVLVLELEGGLGGWP